MQWLQESVSHESVINQSVIPLTADARMKKTKEQYDYHYSHNYLQI